MIDIQDLFATYQTEAFRLEILPQYQLDNEWSNFQRYITDDHLSAPEGLRERLIAIAEKTATGAQYLHARVIDTPIALYQRFQVLTQLIPAAALGADIRFIERENFLTLLHNEFGGNFEAQDFWLFDKTHLVVVHHDEEGRFERFEAVTDPKIVQACIILRQCLLIDCFDMDALLEAYPDL